MLVKSSDGGGAFAEPPEGTHLARCVKIIDLGTRESEYNGEKRSRREVVIAWELPDELIPKGEAAGKPFVVSKFYTASLSEKATLRHDLEKWRAKSFTPEELKGFDLKAILGKACMVTVVQKEGGKRRVEGVSSVPKGMTVPPQVNPSVYFSTEPDEFDQNVFNALSAGFQKMIMESPEYQQLQGTPPADKLDDDIPF